MKRVMVSMGTGILDMIAKGRRIPRVGETVIGDSFSMQVGGKGANCAAQNALLGADSYFFGKLGADDMGRRILQTLQSRNVKCDHVLVSTNEPTGVSPIMMDENGLNSIMVTMGANKSYGPNDACLSLAKLSNIDALLLQLELPMQTNYEAIDFVSKNHPSSLIAMNLSPVPTNSGEKNNILEYCLQKCHVICMNEVEASQIMNRSQPLQNIEETGSICKHLVNRMLQPNSVSVITLGKLGSVAASKSDTIHVQGTSDEAINSVGAGDAFFASLCFALCERRNIEQASILANTAAGMTVRRDGAIESYQSINDIEERMSKEVLISTKI